jgi:hypothetical protein
MNGVLCVGRDKNVFGADSHTTASVVEEAHNFAAGGAPLMGQRPAHDARVSQVLAVNAQPSRKRATCQRVADLVLSGS